jgi:hypothetical protein
MCGVDPGALSTFLQPLFASMASAGISLFRACRAHFVREMILDAYLTVKFCRSRDMLADGFSKKITGDLYDHQRPSYLLSSDDLDKDVDDPNTIGRVLEYVLVDEDSEARPALDVRQTSMGTLDQRGPTRYESSLRNGQSYLRDGNPRHVSVSPNG